MGLSLSGSLTELLNTSFVSLHLKLKTRCVYLEKLCERTHPTSISKIVHSIRTKGNAFSSWTSRTSELRDLLKDWLIMKCLNNFLFLIQKK